MTYSSEFIMQISVFNFEQFSVNLKLLHFFVLSSYSVCLVTQALQLNKSYESEVYGL